MKKAALFTTIFLVLLTVIARGAWVQQLNGHSRPKPRLCAVFEHSETFSTEIHHEQQADDLEIGRFATVKTAFFASSLAPTDSPALVTLVSGPRLSARAPPTI